MKTNAAIVVLIWGTFGMFLAVFIATNQNVEAAEQNLPPIFHVGNVLHITSCFAEGTVEVIAVTGDWIHVKSVGGQSEGKEAWIHSHAISAWPEDKEISPVGDE